ncbi:MAG: SatD family protein [Suipraeoptans sp.]
MYFDFESMPYIAIIGDIKDSKKIANRNEVQKKLNKVLEMINETYSKSISANFVITLGDEFQGVLSCGEEIMNILFDIEHNMYPVKIRFGIGIGKITTDINREMSIGADGPGYYKAREAIEFLKESEKRKRVNPSDIFLKIEGDNSPQAKAINTIFSLMKTVKDAWSDRQREIIWDAMEHKDNQIDIANRFGIKQSSVQKGLSKGKYYAYIDAAETINEIIGKVRR